MEYLCTLGYGLLPHRWCRGGPGPIALLDAANLEEMMPFPFRRPPRPSAALRNEEDMT